MQTKMAWLVAGLVVTAGCTNAESPNVDLALAKFQIVGGAPDTSHPAVGALDLGGGLCTGTLIAPRLVVTAAHCFEGASAQAFILGSSMNSASAVSVTAVKSIQHPQYQSMVAENGQYVGWHDIGVVVLGKDAPATPMPYRTESLSGQEGSSITFVGFGESNIGKRYALNTVIGDVWSQGFWNYVSSQYPGDTCSGDSGGPALMKVNGVEQIIGVVSSGDEYCQQDGYNTRTDTNAAWLAQMMSQYGGGTTTKCGNGTCDSGETAATCPADCASTTPVCGNGACESGETASNCPADCGGGSTGDCQTCVNQSCSSQMNACANSQACVDLYNCVAECQDQSCVDTCAQQYPNGISGLNALFQCVDQSCGTECGGGSSTGACGDGTCDSGETASSCPADCGGGSTGDCQACVDQSCSSQMDACANSQACVDLYNCVAECQDQSCVDTCAQQYPNGISGLNALFQCVDQSCGTECGGGSSTGACGDGTCDSGETASSCPADCGGGSTGDLWTPCGSSGQCPSGQACVQTGDGNFCTVECSDTTSGAGCPSGFACFATSDGSGVCAPSGTTCGDGLCGLGETQGSCPKDCYRECGSIDDVGCCAGNVVNWCEDGLLKQFDCGSTACGWSAESSYYDCTGQATADPSGQYALACGTLPGGEDTGPVGGTDSGPAGTDLGGGTSDGDLPVVTQDAYVGTDVGGTPGTDTGSVKDTGRDTPTTGKDATGGPGIDVAAGVNGGTDGASSGGGCTAGATGASPSVFLLLSGMLGLAIRRRRA